VHGRLSVAATDGEPKEDCAGGCGFVELSTDSYSPNGVIWRWIAARDVQCVFPGCSHPATGVEIDHRVPWPQGKTSTWNIQPLCEKHHKVKHSLGCADEAVCGDDPSTSWLDDYCPDEETSWFDEHGDAFEAAFRDWFEREVAPSL
jgi:hypothetical protein